MLRALLHRSCWPLKSGRWPRPTTARAKARLLGTIRRSKHPKQKRQQQRRSRPPRTRKKTKAPKQRIQLSTCNANKASCLSFLAAVVCCILAAHILIQHLLNLPALYKASGRHQGPGEGKAVEGKCFTSRGSGSNASCRDQAQKVLMYRFCVQRGFSLNRPVNGSWGPTCVYTYIYSTYTRSSPKVIF